MKCPICKKGDLQLHSSSDTMKTLVCDDCSKIINVRGNGESMEMIVMGIGMFAGLAAILEFLGIDNIDELVEVLGI